MERKRLNVLQSWRFLAFLTIFIHHCVGMVNINYGIAGLGVEFFFVLSGFMMAYNYWDKFDKKSTKKETWDFIVKKVKKFYPLLIVTILLKAPVTLYKYYLEVGGINLEYFGVTISRLIPSIFLFQSYIPNEDFYYAFNGVAWFLDVIILCYLFTPRLINRVNKLNSKKLIIIMIIISALKLLYNYFIIPLLGKYGFYASYIFPFYRFFDYLQGLLLGGIFLNLKNAKTSKCKMSILEISILILLILGYHFRLLQSYKTIQELLSIAIVLIYAFESGVISKILNNKILIYLGGISMELYLVHQPIIKYFEFFSDKIGNTIVSTIFFIMSFIVSLILAIFLNKYLKKILDKLILKFKMKSKKKLVE